MRTTLFLLSALLTASPPVAAGEAATIRIAINSDILSTNPGVRRDGNTDTVLYHVAEALVAYREDLTVGPMLADAVTVSGDRKTYTFDLRRGVRFHNGVEMTAADVVWSWRRLLEPKTGFRCREFFDGTGPGGLKIEDVSAPEPYQVVFTLNIPSALFLDRMANIQCLTAVLHPTSVDAAGEWRGPVATGPYKIGVWKRGQYVELERFDGYTPRAEPRSGLTGRKEAAVPRLRFVVTPDHIAAMASLYAGDIDLVFAVPLNTVGELQRRQARRGDIAVHRHATLDWTVLLMQSKDSLLKDARLRQAIAHAISPELVAEVSTYGFATANTAAVPRVSAYHRGFHESWHVYDPAKARALAREAGYTGQVLTIQTNRKFSYMYDNAVAIQAMLTAAGFNVRIEMSDWATQFSNFLSGKFQLSSFGYSSRSHPALMYGNFIGVKEARQSVQWENPRALALTNQLEVAFEDQEIERILGALHDLMVADTPLIGLYNDTVVDVGRSSLEGYAPWAFGRPRLWGVGLRANGSAP